MAIAAEVNTLNSKVSSIKFLDINDQEVYTEINQKLEEVLSKANKNEDIINVDNNLLYFFKGDGSHKLKTFFKENKLLEVCSQKSLEYALTTSIEKTPLNITELENKIKKLQLKNKLK